jgi:cytochrome c oxidase subunit 3
MTSIRPTSSTDSSAALAIHDEHSDHSEHGDHRMFGLATFLVADGMTFAGFFAAYLTFRAVNPLPSENNYELELLLPTINTVLLLVSSFTFHRAGAALRRQQNDLCQRWLLITAVLGFSFLAGQMKEYFSLPFGLTDNLFASTFYAITGFHAENPFPLEAAELYWHFVDGIWVVLYGILYLL